MMESSSRRTEDCWLAELADSKSVDLEPTVHVYDVPSAREVATVVHDRVPRSQRLRATLNGSGFGFTPDGRYFIPSSNNKVKIWQLDGAN